jgi:dolichyl-phosphate beta-glucosyltransferase
VKRPELSVVIPVYNEESRVGKTLEDSLAYLKKRKIRAEILVVDDGSKDKTFEVVGGIKRKVRGFTLKILQHEVNRGKGAAVQTGALAAQGETILFMDADNATPLSEFDKFRPLIKEGVEVIVGSRAVNRKEVKVPQPLYRQALGRLANLLIQLMVVPGIWDTQCGFKAFTRKASLCIFPIQTINRFGFDFELLFLAHKLGFSMREISVQWFNSPYSKVRMGDYVLTFIELISIRWNDLKRRYDPKPPAK